MMLYALRQMANRTRTENGAVTPLTTRSDVLDLFSTVGALRAASDQEIVSRFQRAWAEDRDLAVRTLFYARDVCGGLGERRVFRVLLKYLAQVEPETVRRNLRAVAEYGRWDDLLELMGTPCERDLMALIAEQIREDLVAVRQQVDRPARAAEDPPDHHRGTAGDQSKISYAPENRHRIGVGSRAVRGKR